MRRLFCVLTLVTLVFSSCQKDPSDPQTSDLVLSRIEYRLVPDNGSIGVDSFIYNSSRQVIAKISYSSTSPTQTRRTSYSYSGSKVIIDDGDTVVVTIDPATRDILKYDLLPEGPSINGKDTVFHFYFGYEYGADGFRKKMTINLRQSVLYQDRNERHVTWFRNFINFTNDGRNITESAQFEDEVDSLFDGTTGAYRSRSLRYTRQTTKYGFQPGDISVKDYMPYREGRANAQLTVREDVVYEASDNRGVSWRPGGPPPYSRAYVHELKDGLLRKTTFSDNGSPAGTLSYFYRNL